MLRSFYRYLATDVSGQTVISIFKGKAWPFNKGSIGCPETSVIKYQSTLEDRSSELEVLLPRLKRSATGPSPAADECNPRCQSIPLRLVLAFSLLGLVIPVSGPFHSIMPKKPNMNFCSLPHLCHMPRISIILDLIS